MTQKNDRDVHVIPRQRLVTMLKEEAANPMGFWFLSFAGREHGWRGVIVEAQGFAHAYVTIGILECNPGGEVLAIEIPADQIPPSQYHNRMLTKTECEEFWGDMKTTEQWDEEYGVSGPAEPDFTKSKTTEDGNIRWRNQGKVDD